jgi:hypothetical protein
VKGLVPVAMILIGRGGPREHPPTSRGKGPTRADIAQLPVAHAHTPSTHSVTTGDIAQLLVAHAHT